MESFLSTHLDMLREIGMAIVQGKTTVAILGGLLEVIRVRMKMTRGAFIMHHSEFWSAERMLGFDFNKYSGAFGKYSLDFVFHGEVGKIMYAEILSEKELLDRYGNFDLACEETKGISHIRIPLHYRQKFIGFFAFERKEGDNGLASSSLAELLQIVGAIVADVAETRTHQMTERARLLAVNAKLKRQIEPVSTELVGESESMREVYTQIRQVAPTDATVLIRGGSGTGKELLAKSIVDMSPRKNRPFLTINCAALPETLIESELFGHEKGSFTGAIDRRIGRAEAADGGTLFLDEVGDLTPATQVKLLRFLQERTFSRIGSNTELHSDVRFIAATSRNLEELIEKKLFREDLYYRLNIFAIQVPALSERKGDIVLLARHFAKKFNSKYGKNIKKFSPDVTAALIDYNWPGNVRELENCIERAVLTSVDDEVRLANLPPSLRPLGYKNGDDDAGMAFDTAPKSLPQKLAEYEKSLIDKAVDAHRGNLSAAARELGISPRMIYYKLGLHK